MSSIKEICFKLFQILCIIKHIDFLNLKKKNANKINTDKKKNPKGITPESKISYVTFKSRVWPNDASLKIVAYIRETQMC